MLRDLKATDRILLTLCNMACERGHSGVVKILMENASTLNIYINTKRSFENYDAYGLCFNTWSSTGFQMACKEGHSDVIKIFLKNELSARLLVSAKKKESQKSKMI